MTDRRGQTAPQDSSAFYTGFGAPQTLPMMRGPEDLPEPDQPSASELFHAGVVLQEGRNTNAEMNRTYAAYEPILAELNKGEGFFTRRFANPGEIIGGEALRPLGGSDRRTPREKVEQEIWAEIARRRATDPKFLPNVPATLDEFHAQILKKEQERRAAARAVTARNRTFMGGVAEFAGGTLEGFDDPLVIATLPVGGPGKTFATRVLAEGAAQMGIQAILEPQVVKNLTDLGEKVTPGEVATDILSAGAAGAGFQGLVAEPVSALLKRFLKVVPAESMTDAERGAVNVLEREAQAEALNPFESGIGSEVHAERLNKAMEDIAASLPGGSGPPPTRGNLRAGTSLGSGVVGAPVEMSGIAERANFKARVRGAESSGSDLAANARSTAFGRYQFTEPTWKQYYLRRYGRNGLSDAQIAAKRADPSLNEQLMDDLIADNVRALHRIGARETAGNLYLLHFAGESGGTAILRAAPDTPVERILTADAITANPFLRGRTAGEVVAWAHRRMGERVDSAPLLRRDQLPAGDEGDAEWRAAQRYSDEIELERERLDFREEGATGDELQARPMGRPDSADGIGIAAEPVAANWGRRKPTVTRSRPSDVVEFLADRGGIRDDEGHALSRFGTNTISGRTVKTSQDWEKVFVPRAGRLVRKTGMSIDEAGELLHEAGFFVDRPSERQVLDLLDRAINGKEKKIYPLEHQAEMDSHARSALEEAKGGALADNVEHELRGLVDREKEQPLFEAVVARVANGETPNEALENAVILDGHSTLYMIAQEADDGRYDWDPDELASLHATFDAGSAARHAEAGGGGPAAQPAGAGGSGALGGTARPTAEAWTAALDHRVEVSDTAPTADQLAPSINAFSDPASTAAREMAEGLTHDIRQSLDTGELGNIEFAAEGVEIGHGEQAAVYRDAASILDELDAEDAAIKNLGDCL